MPKHLLVLSFAVLLIAACKKDDISNHDGNTRAKTIVVDYHLPATAYSDTFHLTYDGNGQLATAITPTDIYTYVYSANTVVWDIITPGSSSIHEIGYMKDGV